MISIGKKSLGNGFPCFIIAEAGVNHNGDLELAKRLIDAAYNSGADAVKFQTFKTDHLVTNDAEKAQYQKENDNDLMTQYEMLKKLELSENDFKVLSVYAKKKGIIFLSTAFDDESINIIARLDVPAYKIPSGEITNLPYLEMIALQKKPVILSTGMSTIEEIRQAVTWLQKNGCTEIILLHCTSSYPAPLKSVNLRAMDTLKHMFDLPVGYSDHTEDILVAVSAVAMGACIIEKHLTLDRSLPGPDHAASLEPGYFKKMVDAIRNVEIAMGSSEKKPQESEICNRQVARRSIVASQDISGGVQLSEEMLSIKRPGT